MTTNFKIHRLQGLGLALTVAFAIGAWAPKTVQAQLGWAPIDPFGGVCSTISVPPPANLNICEYAISAFTVNALDHIEPACAPVFFCPSALWECIAAAAAGFPVCVVPKTVVDVYGYIYYADEVECSIDDQTATDLIENIALQQIENVETLTTGGINSALYTLAGQHIDLLECSAQELSAPLKDIMRRMRDRVGFSKEDAFADLDLDTMRIVSQDTWSADVYLQSNRAITLGHLVILEQRPPERPMWDIISSWNRTWDDVINGRLCPQERAALSLILHEAVHVRQYRNLGKETFVNQYLPDLLISNVKEAEAYRFSESKVETSVWDNTLLEPSVPDVGAVRAELNAITMTFGEPLGCLALPPILPGPGGPLAVAPTAHPDDPIVRINSICGAMSCAPGFIECDQPHAAAINFDGAASDPMGIVDSEWFIPGAAMTRTTLGNGFMISGVLPSESPGVSGRHRINFSATDGEGRVAVASTVINVRDTTEPVVTLNPGPSTIECNVETYVEPGATAADGCDPAVTNATPFGGVNATVTGENTIWYLAADDAGNFGFQSRVVDVVDTRRPTIEAPPEIVTQDRTPDLGTAIATDVCTETPLIDIDNDAPLVFPYGTTVVTWWSRDAAGLESLHDTQTVTVIGGDASTAGRDYSCGLSREGEVFCWGANQLGQLGDGANVDRWGPLAINMTGTAAQISLGSGHTCAVKDDRTVQCWGNGGDGRLGNNSTANRSLPVTVSGLANVQQVSAGGQVGLLSDDGHTCAVVDGGGVRCWGEGGKGQLGNASTLDRSIPVVTQPPAGGAFALQVTTGGEHSCMVDALGRVFCWGEGADGRLGNGNADKNVPTLVPLASGVAMTQIDAGERHTCAVDTLGSVWCWGEGGNGRLGVNSTSDRPAPTQVTLPAAATQVSAGNLHSCALLTDGRVFCWGSPLNGRLGDGVVIFDQLVPIQATGISGAVQVSAGFDHTCARIFSAGAYIDRCWGSNGNGELGDGTSVDRATSVQISTVCSSTGFFPMSGGELSSCTIALGSQDPASVMCWGSNGSGRLGDGATTGRRAPTPTVNTDDAIIASAGGSHACALTPSSQVQCWGNNMFGQVGNGTIATQTTPTLVSDLSTYSLVATGGNHSCGITTTGAVKCWGLNLNGQLGDGTIFTQLSPVTVTGLPGQAMWIDAGTAHTCAVVQNAADREVWCWGAGLHGRLGNGFFFDSWAPVRAGTITDAFVVSTGATHTCASTFSGPVYCWGRSLSGQVGNDSLFDSWSPVQVIDTANVPLSAPFAFVSAGGTHSCVAPIGPMQQAACWGNNLAGQLGNGSFLLNARAQMISGMPFVSSVTAGENHSCARLSGTNTMCWGANGSGQLGDGTTVARSTPVQVTGACY